MKISALHRLFSSRRLLGSILAFCLELVAALSGFLALHASAAPAASAPYLLNYFQALSTEGRSKGFLAETGPTRESLSAPHGSTAYERSCFSGSVPEQSDHERGVLRVPMDKDTRLQERSRKTSKGEDTVYVVCRHRLGR